MEKPSVKITHPEGYALGGLLLVFSIMPIFPTIAAPPEDRLQGWLLVAAMFVGSLITMRLGATMVIIDENGIYIKGMFKEYCYAWSEIIEIGVARVRNRGSINSYHPEILITVSGGHPRQIEGPYWSMRNARTGWSLDYRRKTWDCIRHYYGQPDFDEWGKPPTVT